MISSPLLSAQSSRLLLRFQLVCMSPVVPRSRPKPPIFFLETLPAPKAGVPRDEIHLYDRNHDTLLARSGFKRPPQAHQVRCVSSITGAPLSNGSAAPSPSCVGVRQCHADLLCELLAGSSYEDQLQAKNECTIAVWQGRCFVGPALRASSLPHVDLTF